VRELEHAFTGRWCWRGPPRPVMKWLEPQHFQFAVAAPMAG
jgi:hypothetical protein